MAGDGPKLALGVRSSRVPRATSTKRRARSCPSIGSFSRADGAHYVNDRLQGDLCSMEARRELDNKLNEVVQKTTYKTLASLGMPFRAQGFRFETNPRLIGRYELGKESAFAILPQITERLTRLLILVKYASINSEIPSELEEILDSLKDQYNFELTSDEKSRLVTRGSNIVQLRLGFTGYTNPWVKRSEAKVSESFNFWGVFGGKAATSWNFYAKYRNAAESYEPIGDEAYLIMISAIVGRE